jgi:hypothetical protein
VLAEHAGILFVDPQALPERTPVVVEGRALLEDKDRVSARELAP